MKQNQRINLCNRPGKFSFQYFILYYFHVIFIVIIYSSSYLKVPNVVSHDGSKVSKYFLSYSNLQMGYFSLSNIMAVQNCG